LNGPPLPPRLAKPLQQVDERLEELKDWRTFSVAPKREELLLEIESLIESTLEPPVLARQIRELQQQWRTLHKGAGEDFALERERFRELAQRAYEPCRLYFAAQAESRAANLLRREELLQRLHAFSTRQTTPDPDWRLILQVLAEARREWRQYFPVEREAARSTQARFDALAGALQDRLNAEYARNVTAKRALIERAGRLLELPDTRKAIDEVKELQSAWKTIGLVARDVAETLWEEFRLHCDAVFRRREEESVAWLAGLEANRSKALALCEDVERISGLTGTELLAGVRQLEDLRTGFEGLELPRAGARELRNRFERALERCLDALAAQRARDAQRVWSEVFAVADRIRALALATVRSADSEARGALRQQAEAAFTSVSEWPKGARALLERSLELAAAGTVSADIAANEEALRVLCVRAEILAEVPSALEDQTLRREQQMQRLLRSMGQGTVRVADQLEELFAEWIVVGPTEEATWERLLERLTAVRAGVGSDIRSTGSPAPPTAAPGRRSSGESSR
jgi:hypothetical protein